MTFLRVIVEEFDGEGGALEQGSAGRTRRRRKSGREEYRGGTGKRARRLGMLRTRHRGFVGEGATLEQSGENEDLEGKIFRGRKVL